MEIDGTRKGHVGMVEDNPKDNGASEQPNEGDNKFQRLEGIINNLVKEIKKQHKWQSQRRSWQFFGGRIKDCGKAEASHSVVRMNHRRKTDRGRHGKPKSNDEEITKAPLEINVCGGALRIRGFINDIPSEFIVDTSADVTIASANLFVKIALTNNTDICLSSGIIKSLNGQAIPVIGQTTVEVGPPRKWMLGLPP